ncbi:hypothetical protein GJAV_G00005880 [Gymnothorax javanicus]|nr:hypothetical protein GJAV_G00005880 [Gymnothorax javanicus]
MIFESFLLLCCIVETIADQDQGFADRMPNATQVSTTTQSTGVLSAQFDTKRPPEDKSQAGQNLRGCYCNAKPKGRPITGCICKKSNKRLRPRFSKAVKKNPKKGVRRKQLGRKKAIKSMNPISTPI